MSQPHQIKRKTQLKETP